MKTVIIYQSPDSLSAGKSTNVSHYRNFFFFGKGIALTIIIFSFSIVFLMIFPFLKKEFYFYTEKKLAERSSQFGVLLEREEREAGVQAINEAKRLDVKNTNFTLVIPKISVNTPIIPNIDPGNEAEYSQALLKGVAHAQGTAFPGMKKTIYLFAHSTGTLATVNRYNAVFYLLPKLDQGDEVIIFYDGKIFRYRVFQKLVVLAEDISWLQNKSPEGILIMQTCWPPGTTWKRLLVFARPR